MQRLEVSGAVRPIYGSLGVKGLIKQTDKFTLTVRNHEGIMSGLPLQISNICVFDYALFQRLLQSLCSRTNARTIFQEYTKFEGDYLFDIQGVYKRMVRFQKLTRNLFLTLHGQNVRRQQRQLSKFLMRYQQFASHA